MHCWLAPPSVQAWISRRRLTVFRSLFESNAHLRFVSVWKGLKVCHPSCLAGTGPSRNIWFKIIVCIYGLLEFWANHLSCKCHVTICSGAMVTYYPEIQYMLLIIECTVFHTIIPFNIPWYLLSSHNISNSAPTEKGSIIHMLWIG